MPYVVTSTLMHLPELLTHTSSSLSSAQSMIGNNTPHTPLWQSHRFAITHLGIHSAHIHEQLNFSYLCEGKNGLWIVKFFHSVHSRILINSSIFLLNAHYIFATTIFYQISPTCFGVLYTILRENFLYWLKTVSFLWGCYIMCYKLSNIPYFVD
jgi:hypothetical protein